MNGAVRVAGLGETDAVMAVMLAAFDSQFGERWTLDQLRGMLIMPGILLLIHADEAGKAHGFALFSRVLDEAELLLLGVDPVNRRQGVATRLLDAGVEMLIEKGVKSLFLEVRDGNVAMNLYSTYGFNAIGRRRDYYHGGANEKFDAITLRRELGAN